MAKRKLFMDLETPGLEIDVMYHTSVACYSGSVGSRIHIVLRKKDEKAIVTVDELEELSLVRSVREWEIDSIAAFKLSDMLESFNNFYSLDIDCVLGHRSIEDLCQLVDKLIEFAVLGSKIFSSALSEKGNG